MRIYKFNIKMFDENGEIVEREVNNAYEFGWPADGKFFYFATKPTLSKETPGKAELETTWIPTEQIIEIQGINTTKFASLKERKTFADSLN